MKPDPTEPITFTFDLRPGILKLMQLSEIIEVAQMKNTVEHVINWKISLFIDEEIKRYERYPSH